MTKPMKIIEAKTSKAFLQKAIQIQEERGKEHGSKSKEDSFEKVAITFTAKTGIKLEAAHIALILQDLKDVRQFGKDRYMEDNLVDCVSYAALKAELVYKKYHKTNKPIGPKNELILCTK